MTAQLDRKTILALGAVSEALQVSSLLRLPAGGTGENFQIHSTRRPQ